VREQDIYAIRGGVVKTMRKTLPAFQGQHLCRRLYASIYSKLLKLTRASNANRVCKIAIGDDYVVDHCWTVACDQHLDGPL